MFALLLGLLLAAPLQITSVTPQEGTAGTQLAIDGAGFGSKRATVRLVDPSTGKRVGLKVLAWSDGHVEALLGKSPPAGVRDLELKRKPKSLPPLLATDAFTVRAPAPAHLDASLAAPKDQVTVSGAWFGSKKGKVRVGGIKAKVTAWMADSATFVVPPKSAGGLRDVTVLNGAGAGTLAAALMVQGKLPVGGPSVLSIVVDGVPLQASGAWRVVGLQGATLDIGASFDGGRSLQISLPVDLSIDGLPLDIAGDAAGFVAWRDGAVLLHSAPTEWSTQGQGESYQVHLAAVGGGGVVGTVSGTLHRVTGEAGPETLVLQAGSFVLALPGAP